MARIISGSGRTPCLPTMWYFASSKYALREFGVQLMLVHKCKNLPDVKSVHFHIRLSVHTPAMVEHIIEVAGHDFSY